MSDSERNVSIPPQAANGRIPSVIVACSGAFVAALSTSLVAVAAPTIGREFGVSQGDVGWVLSAYLLTISATLAGAGRLADARGRRRVYTTGLILFGAASFACAAAPSLLLLVAARTLQGLGAAALMATGPAIVTRAFPARLRARGLGIQLAATYAGLTLGPTLGGFLTTTFSWHAVFALVGLAAMLGLALAVTLLPPDADEGIARPPLDAGGALLFGLGLAALLVGLRRGAGSTGSAAALGAILAASAAFALFVRHESRHPAPVLPLALLRAPAFVLGLTGALCLYVVAFVLAWLLPFELQHARGLDARHAGTLMTAQPAVMAIVAPVSGILADRFGPRLPSVAGMVAIATGLFLVRGAAESTSASDVPIVLALAVVGLGAGLFVAPNNALIMTAAPRDRQATAAAMAATARNVGMAIGVALAALLNEAIGFARALVVASAIAVVGAVVSLVRPAQASSGPAA